MNKLDATCKQACIATSRDKSFMKRYKTIIDYNDCNDSLFPNENIRNAIHKVIEEDEYDSHNITLNAYGVTADSFSQTSNTQI